MSASWASTSLSPILFARVPSPGTALNMVAASTTPATPGTFVATVLPETGLDLVSTDAGPLTKISYNLSPVLSRKVFSSSPAALVVLDVCICTFSPYAAFLSSTASNRSASLKS